MNLAEKLIQKHEGRRNKPYLDSVNVLTVGVGHNQNMIITDEVVDLLFKNDMKEVYFHAHKFDWFGGLNEPRQAVVLNMVFNLGIGRFKAFKKTIQAIIAKDWYEAAEQMKSSKWHSQVGYRAVQLESMMRLGEFVE